MYLPFDIYAHLLETQTDAITNWFPWVADKILDNHVILNTAANTSVAVSWLQSVVLSYKYFEYTDIWQWDHVGNKAYCCPDTCSYLDVQMCLA